MEHPTPAPKTNPRHELFISQMLLHGDKLRAYKAAYPKATDEAARTASTRLLNNPYVSEKLRDAYNAIHIGVAEDRMAFIHQELKIIKQKRKLLIRIIAGERDATVNEQIKAIRLDNELAEQQAQLLNYGSIKPAKQSTKKTAETVTNMNNERDAKPASPAVASAKEGKDNGWPGEAYPGGLNGDVTKGTNYTCSADEHTPEPHDPLAWYAAAVEENDRKWAEKRKENAQPEPYFKKQWEQAEKQIPNRK